MVKRLHDVPELLHADGDTDKAAKGVGRKLLWAAPDNSDTLKDISEFAKTYLYRDWETDRKSTRLNSSHRSLSRMPSSA